MTKKILLPVLLVAFALTSALRAAAQGPNGTNPRPFYVIAHNPNTIADVEDALRCANPGDPCANALEPDLIVLPVDDFLGLPHDTAGNPDPHGVVVYHDNSGITIGVPPTVPQYLATVHNLAIQHPQLAMIMFDIKPQAAKADLVLQVWNDVQTFLNTDGVQLTVIFSVAERSEIGAFDKIIPLLKEWEGVQVDDDNNAELVVNDFLAAFNVHNLSDGNIAWGDGTLGPGPNIPRAVDLASFLRASTGNPKMIGDIYTIKLADSMALYMDAGADGIIPDDLNIKYSLLNTAGYISTLQDVLKQHPQYRLATHDDNPFKPENQAYGLEVTTLDVNTGGTDAPLTFTLEGCRGTSEVTVHTGFAPNGFQTDRMERGGTDHVTIPSLDLGKLTKLHVHNLGGAANAPDWAVGTVALSSVKYLGANMGHSTEYTATFNNFVFADKTAAIDLHPNFTEPPPTIECPAPITVNNSPGKCSAIVSFSTPAAGMCNDVTTSSIPASGSSFDVGVTGVTSTASSPTTGSNSCSFHVTVKDAEAPLLACPGPQVVDATSPQGAPVTFASTAADNCSVSSVTSAPPSGSQFIIGDTLVTSVAQDPSGNQSSCSFNVHVKSAAEQLTDLITVVNNLGLDAGNKNALLVKLQQALAKLSDSNGGPVCGPLKSFINQVSALSGKDISTSDADHLIAQATNIRTVVGCS